MNPDLDLFLKAAGELAAQEAERQWHLDIFDPSKSDKSPRARACAKHIEGIIERAGWGFATPYIGNGQPQWCGMFAFDCWREAGIETKWAASLWASTYRLKLFFNYQRFSATSVANAPPPPDVPRRLWTAVGMGFKPRFTPRRGDVVIVGDGNPDDGDHVNVLVGYNEATMEFDTISGNGGGIGPKGNAREGISRKTYRIDQGGYRVMFVGRPAPGDIVNFSVER